MRPWRRPESKKNDLPKSSMRSQWLLFLLAAIGILFSFLLWYIFLLQETANLNQLVQTHSVHMAEDIKLQFDLRITALKGMAKHLYTGTGSKLNNWQDITEYVAEYGGFEGIAWTDTNFKPIYSNFFDPSIQNKIFPNYFLSKNTAILEKANQHQPYISAGFDLPNKHKGAFIVIPINFNGALEGYLIALIDLNNSFKLHLDPADYSVIIFYGNEKVLQNGLLKSGTYSISKVVFELYDITWTVLVQPSKHLAMAIRTILPVVALFGGIAIALLFTLSFYLLKLARQRAVSLQKINLDLKKEITEREEAQSQKELLEKGLLQGQKLQAIGTLAGGIAHDFNNLLYAIIGYVEMAQEDIKKDTITYENLGKVLEASHRGRDLIARILAFSRRHHHELKAQPLLQCIQSVLDLLIPTVPASITIELINHLPANTMVLADATRLHQIVVNIVNNAVDAMDAEGNITITLSLINKDNPVLKKFPNLPAGNYCKIDIMDTGHGMEQTTVERVFEPFFTTKEVGKGTGLGLATVHTIVKEHNGEIMVKSKMGEGTTFTILIPEYTEKAT